MLKRNIKYSDKDVVNEPSRSIEALNEWYQHGQGQILFETYQALLTPYRSVLHGERLLQLGVFDQTSLLNFLRFTHRWQVSPNFKRDPRALQAEFSQLPFPRNTFNTILAPLSLNCLDARDWPLDEIDRVLKPMGYLVIFTINPYSLWGAALKTGYLSAFGDRGLSPMPILKLKKELEHRGYTQLHLQYFYYLPPISSPKWLARMTFLNHMGQMLPPCPASFYWIIMQKFEPASPDLQSVRFRAPEFVSGLF